MKTYSEECNVAPIDWYSELNRILTPDGSELSILDHKAAQWTTCAVGNQDARIPRTGTGTPCDQQLAVLGVQFSRQINAISAAKQEYGKYRGKPYVERADIALDNTKKALITLHKIEKVADYILKEMEMNKTQAFLSKLWRNIIYF